MIFFDRRFWLWTGLILLMGACSTPSGRQVQDIDTSEERIQIIYDEETSEGEQERGMVECDFIDGEVTNCVRLDVEYQ